MLAKKFRIAKQKEVEAVFKRGQSSFDNIIGIKRLKNNKDINRFVVVVSTKVSKKAVERNKIKRRISEICRVHYKEFGKGSDFFILALPAIINKKYQEIDSSILKHLKKLKNK